MNQEELSKGYALLISNARLISLLPVDKWLADLEHAETVGPILDPEVDARKRLISSVSFRSMILSCS